MTKMSLNLSLTVQMAKMFLSGFSTEWHLDFGPYILYISSVMYICYPEYPLSQLEHEWCTDKFFKIVRVSV